MHAPPELLAASEDKMLQEPPSEPAAKKIALSCPETQDGGQLHP